MQVLGRALILVFAIVHLERNVPETRQKQKPEYLKRPQITPWDETEMIVVFILLS